MNKTMKLMMAVAICALATAADAAVRTWPQPKEMARSADFALTAGGQSVDVLATAKPQKRILECLRHPYSFAMFESCGPVEVEVARLGTNVTWREVRVLPEGMGVKPAVTDGRARFTLPGPCTAVFEPDGRHRALVIIVQPPEKNAPKDGDKGVVYVGPGVHSNDLTRLGANETLYLAPGAVLRGAVKAEGDGVCIRGRGIIDGTPWPWANGPGRGRLVSVSGRGTEVRDVTLLSSFEWTLVLDAVTNAVVDNVKVLGGRVINDDGIDICRAKDVTVRNSFVRCQDDCIAPKWWCEHATVTNCTFWTDVANIVRIGYESDPPPARFHDFRMADCDILHLTLEPTPMTAYWCNTALSVQASNEERIGDVVFENLRFHEISGDDVLLVAKTFAVTQGYSYPKAGFIDGLLLKDICLPAKDGALPAVYVETADAEHKVRNLRFENVTGAAPERRVCVAKPAARTLHLIGDSTLEYRPAGSAIASWGELLRERLPEGFGLENHAVSGQSTRSFRPDWERDVLPRLKKGDVALIQFGHNDPWRWPAEYLRRGEVPRECSPAEMQANLERYVKEAREKGAEAVLLTPTPQRRRSARHEPYLAAIRAAATATGSPLVDLTELAGAKVWALGEEESKALFANDDVHPNLKGARLFADIGFAAIAAAKVLRTVDDRLAKEFISHDGLLLDYVGDVPTPEEIAALKPNAMGWWCPIENGSMFTGEWLPALMAEGAGRKDLVERCVRGLIRMSEVSDVPGFVARGTGTDGRSHHPCGSNDQTDPWFLGLCEYCRWPYADAALKTKALERLVSVAKALEKNAWGVPCDGPFKGENRGNLNSREMPFWGKTRLLYSLKSLERLTGDAHWGEVYGQVKASALEEIEAGGEIDAKVFKGCYTWGVWIYLSSAQALGRLIEMEENPSDRERMKKGLSLYAERVAPLMKDRVKYANTVERPFKYANWRTGYRWREQKTQKDAEQVAFSGKKEILGSRKDYERNGMANPLAAAAVCALSGDARFRDEILDTLRHYDYSTPNISEFFHAAIAAAALR